MCKALWRPEATENSSNSRGGKAVLKTEASGRGAALTRGLHSFSAFRKVLEHSQLCATGVKQSEEKSKFGAGVGSQRRAKEQVYSSPTWDESRERKRKSRKAGGTRAAAGPRVSSRLEHLQRGVVLRKVGSGEQPTHRPPPDHRLPPWDRDADESKGWRTLECSGGECRTPVPLRRRVGIGGVRVGGGNTAGRRGRCGGARGNPAGRAHPQQLVG